MKTLFYAFEPFGAYPRNISQDTIRVLPNSPNIKKIILPTTFDHNLYRTFLSSQPDIIIGLGQYPRGHKIRIERRATNLYRSSKNDLPRPILPNSPPSLPVTLKLTTTKNSRYTYNAGTYVCNYSMFHTLNITKNTKTLFGFLHIPLSQNPNIVANEIKQIYQNTLQLSLA